MSDTTTHIKLLCSFGWRTYVERFREPANARVFIEALLGKHKHRWESPHCIVAREANALRIECDKLKDVMATKGGEVLHKDTKAKILAFFTGEWKNAYDDVDIPPFLRRQTSAPEPGTGAVTIAPPKRSRLDKPKGLTDEEYDELRIKFGEAAKPAKVAKEPATGGPDKPAKPPKPAGSGSRTAQIVALMQRPGGVTREEVLAATGWTAVSMQQQAKQGGVTLKVDKSVRPYRYMVE